MSLGSRVRKAAKHVLVVAVVGVTAYAAYALLTHSETPPIIPPITTTDNPPQIISYEIPDSVFAGEKFYFKVEVIDDNGVENVELFTLQYPDGKDLEKIKDTYTWRLLYTFNEGGDFTYKIIATDTKDQKSDSLEGIIVSKDLPDLVVEKIEHFPGEWINNEREDTIDVYVMNDSKKDINSPFDVSLEGYGVKTIESLAGGESAKVKYTVKLPEGNYILKGITDSGNTIEEINEGNNNDQITITVSKDPLPDLVVKNTYIHEGEWSNDYRSRNYTLEVIIANIGSAPAGPSDVSLSGSDLGQLVKSVNNIDPTGEDTVVFDINLALGQHSIMLNPDFNGKVVEINESNTHSKTIDVSEPPFELVDLNLLSPDLFDTYHTNSLEDYRKVLEVYGIKEEDAKMVVGVGKGGYTSIFYYGSNVGTGGTTGHNDFTTDRRGMRHEMGHAFNNTLFPTYHTWFDEGMAMYADGTVEKVVEWSKTHDGNFFWSTVKREEDPDQYWSEAGGFVPGHVIGDHLFGLMMLDYGLTPEKNRTALSLLSGKYLQTGTELTKQDIENTYETVLGVSLDPLFDFLKIGVMKLYQGQLGDKIKSEF